MHTNGMIESLLEIILVNLRLNEVEEDLEINEYISVDCKVTRDTSVYIPGTSRF